jgi:homoserine kinase
MTVQIMEKIKVFAPASIANVSCGFDVLGFAIHDLGDILEAEINNTGKLVIASIDGAKGIPLQADRNIMTIAAQALLDDYGSNPGFTFRLTKTVMAGSGLGSSASSAAAGAFAVNELLGRPFTRKELVRYAGIGEQVASNQLHHDNVAPSVLGGFVIVRSSDPLDVLSIPYPDDLHVVIVHQLIEIKTQQAKRMLGRDMSISNAVIQFGNIAGLVAGMIQQDYGIIGRSMVDVLAEPKRSRLIPRYDDLKRAMLEAGAVGCNIAGSGPAVFSFCQGAQSAAEVLQAAKSVFSVGGVGVDYYMSKINPEGVKVIS